VGADALLFLLLVIKAESSAQQATLVEPSAFSAHLFRPTGHVETSLNARSKTSATLPVWTVTLNASAMHSKVVSWKAKMK
jgi:hypothetical protein